MLKVRLHAPTQKSFEQFRTDLNRAVEDSFVSPFMTRRWSDRTLRTAAPATEGFIRFEPTGVYAEFQISWPGIPMKDVIVQESYRILAKAAGGPVSRLE
jgi:hypothetical protein